MTPAQLDHLRKIDAHLERLLELAAKRTPGEWLPLDGRPYVYDIARDGTIASTDTSGKFDKSERLRNAAFIASCAGNAEAGWKATRAAIAWLQHIGETSSNVDKAICGNHIFNAEDALKGILAALPLESLEA